MQRRKFLNALGAMTALQLMAFKHPAVAGEQKAGDGGRFSSGLLWQIDKPGVKPSFVFGTLHRPDARLMPLPAPVAAAFDRCRRLVVEMLPNPAVSQRFSEAMRLPAGESLEALMATSQFELLVDRLSKQGLDRNAVARVKPWAALLLVTSIFNPSAAGEAGESLTSIDTELFVRARFANRPVEELETVEEQIAVFDDIPQTSQLALLGATLSDFSVLSESAEASVQAYLARDLRALKRAGRRLEIAKPALETHQRILEKKIIHDRSVVMAYRLQYYLRRGETFAAIGASHLIGSLGVPAILEEEYEWRVKRVW